MTGLIVPPPLDEPSARPPSAADQPRPSLPDAPPDLAQVKSDQSGASKVGGKLAPEAEIPGFPTEVGGIQATTEAPSFGERFSAGWKKRTIETDMLRYSSGVMSEMLSGFIDALPADAQARVTAARDQPGGYLSTNAERGAAWRKVLFEEMQAIIDLGPAGNPALAGAPRNEEEFQKQYYERRRSEYDEAAQILEIDGQGFGGFLGELSRDVVDPINLGLAPFGVSGGLLRTFAAETALGGVAAAASLPREYTVADDLDLSRPNALERIATEALAGGLLGTTPLAIFRGAQAVTARKAGKVDGNQSNDAEEALVRGNDPAIVPSRPTTPTYIETPPNWEPIKNGIFAGESGGDYDALFGYQNRPGGQFSNVRVTEMTVDQAIAFSNVNGRYGQWVKGQIGRVATPMGAYQIVGTTLRAAKKGLGLRGDELMTEGLQDQLGIWIYRQQGTGAWEGYRGPRSTPPRPNTGGAPAGDFQGYNTSRGYTGSGQVGAGRDFRIDVDYEVVDASSLIRASGALQPRDRARSSSDEQVAEIAATLDPARLMPAPEADRGAPIVGPDNIIESGNGRVMAIQRAFERHPDRAEAYRTQIEAAGYEIPEGVSTPVLIARRTSDLPEAQRQDFVRQANFSATARMSATERAAVDARSLDADTVALFDATQPLTARANVPFTQRVLNSLPQTERNALVDGSGRLNAEGVTRVRQAMFARAFDAPDILARYAEADAGDLRGLMDALEGAAPSWAGLRSAIADGRVRDDLDVTPFLMDAMRLIADARRIAMRENKASADMVEELLADVDLLDGALPPLTAALVRKLYPSGRALPAPKVTEFLTRFAAEAQKVGRTDASLFDDGVGVLDVLTAIDKSTFGKLTETGTARIPDTARPTPADMPADAIQADAFAKGAHSPDAEEADALLRAEFEDLQIAHNPRGIEQAMARSQPVESLDDLFEIAPRAQQELAEIGARIEQETGATFRNPGLKSVDVATAKMQRKKYRSPSQMTDVSRGGFVANSPDQADQIVELLAREGPVLDRGWARTPAGYVDRKVLYQTKSGLVAEVQIWSPELLKAKNADGHALYKQARAASDDSVRADLEERMKSLYSAAIEREDASYSNVFGTSSGPNVRSNVDLSVPISGSTRAVSNTSSASTGSQSPPGSVTASASPRAAENNTAGRPSQSQNVNDVMGNTSETNLRPDGPKIKDFSADEIRSLVRDLGGDADLEIPLENGTTFSTRQVLDDLDQDEVLDTVIDLCKPGGAG